MELPSRVWSAETLDMGVNLVEQGVRLNGDDTKDLSEEELQRELEQLQLLKD